MHIKEIAIHNFRVLSDSKMDLDKQPCLMIGRNNAGKTSFMVLFEKFMRGLRFDYNDFPIKLREKLLNMDSDTDETKMAIQLLLTIAYDHSDDLRNLSEFIVDLEPNNSEIYLLFECEINKKALLRAWEKAGNVDKPRFIRRHLSDHLKTRIYTFDDPAVITGDRTQMVEKSLDEVKRLIDFDIIHAKRSVASSEERNGRKVLSQLTTMYFNSKNSGNSKSFGHINDLIERTDKSLDTQYDKFFSDFLKSAKDFLDLGSLKVKSNLSAKKILEDASEVVYGDESTQLPEYQNGLGYMNILYLLLSIEIKIDSFLGNEKDIQLLFIEEPEAHTHPQLQYNFARKITDLVRKKYADKKQKIQMVLTTHSPHIVTSYPFENLRYMCVERDPAGFSNIRIKHFHSEMLKAYTDKKEFQFLKQYLTIASSELFFADKAIFIEGTSEALLLPYFIARFDAEQRKKAGAAYIPLAAQNIAVVQAGANAKAFRHFIDFLGIPTLIITDIDTARAEEKISKGKKKPRIVYSECKVTAPEACTTTNATIKYFLQAPAETCSREHMRWFNRMRNYTARCCRDNVHLSYQCLEDGFRPRSFEDAFINVNLDKIKRHWTSIDGLKNKKDFDNYVKNGPQPNMEDIYDLTEKILDGKSGLASSLLYLSYAQGVKWETPLYIKEGLAWLQKQTH